MVGIYRDIVAGADLDRAVGGFNLQAGQYTKKMGIFTTVLSTKFIQCLSLVNKQQQR